tara:strand:- start:1810 stop:2004 length:195 start_codon:yes stop_codon:yes gene_type:complete
MIQKVIIKKVLEVVDNTIGKKFKIIDEITDLFQGLEPRIKKIEKKLKQIEERIDENKHSKEKSS